MLLSITDKLQGHKQILTAIITGGKNDEYFIY